MIPILAQRLRAARNSVNPPIMQREVAKKLGVSPSAVNLWEKGKTEPSATDLVKLSEMYYVSCDWLLGKADKPHRGGDEAAAITAVPVVQASAISSGHWDKVDEFLQTQLTYPANTAAAVVVSSDALASALPMGSYAVVSRGHVANPGQIVLASIGRNDAPILRKLLREGDHDLLVADDTRFPTYRVDESVRILGRVTETVIRRVLP